MPRSCIRRPSASITVLHRREDGTMRRRREGLKVDPAPPDGWQLCRSDERERPVAGGAERGRRPLGIPQQLRLVRRAWGLLVDAEELRAGAGWGGWTRPLLW